MLPEDDMLPSMGSAGLYVWGAYLLTLIALGGEAAMLIVRYRRLGHSDRRERQAQP